MKRLALLALALVLSGLVGCSGETKMKDNQIIVFAAASLSESLEEIKESYEKDRNVELVFNLDSSGTLKNQIDHGADWDIFISAAKKQMDGLDPELVDGLKFYIDSDSRVDLLENKVVLVSKDEDTPIRSFEDLATMDVILAIGNEDVPVGQYSEEIFKSLGIWDQVKEKANLGSNVKEVTTWVGEGAVDGGVVYKTDATAAGLHIIDQAGLDLLDTPVVYPMAKNSASSSALADDFYKYLRSEPAMEIFKKYGFEE